MIVSHLSIEKSTKKRRPKKGGARFVNGQFAYFSVVPSTLCTDALRRGTVTPTLLVLSEAPTTASLLACGPTATVLEQPDAIKSVPVINSNTLFILLTFEILSPPLVYVKFLFNFYRDWFSPLLFIYLNG